MTSDRLKNILFYIIIIVASLSCLFPAPAKAIADRFSTDGAFVSGDGSGGLATPVITATGSLSALTTVYGTPSASTSFQMSGANLDGNVLVTPPTGFEVSTDNVNFTGTVIVSDGTGTIGVTTIYVRLAAVTPVNTYGGNVVLSSPNATSVDVATQRSSVTPASLTITALNQSKAYGTANPLFTVDYTGFVNEESSKNLTTQPTLSTTATTSSSAGTYPITVNGAADPNYTIKFVGSTLTVVPAALTITVLNESKVYGAPMPALTVTYTGFANGDTEASLTTKPTVTTAATASSPVGQYVMHASGASDPNYSITYAQGNLTVTPALLTITANNQTKGYDTPNPVLTVNYSGFVNGDTEASLTPGPTVTTTATLTSPAGTYPITASGASDGNYTITYVTGTLTVSAQAPTITGGGAADLSPLNTVYGTPSTATIFTVSGIGMTAGILVFPPTGFEVSADDVTYSGAITVGSSGIIATTTIYIRLAASTPVGNYSGDIKLTSSGATEVDLTMPSSTVSPASLTVKADDKTRLYDEPNPVFTVSYSGFVNGDSPGQLTMQPVATTVATITSPVGEYPITVTGAVDSNYTITFVAGTLTINPPPPHIVIPNTFTPNGDGINDTWNVKYLDLYPGCNVQIFTRYGQKVFSSNGYGTPWDGTYGGAKVATGTYYYIINLNNGSSPFAGYLAVVR